MWVCVRWKDCCSCLEVVSAPSLQKLGQRQNNCWSGILQRTWEKELNKVTSEAPSSPESQRIQDHLSNHPFNRNNTEYVFCVRHMPGTGDFGLNKRVQIPPLKDFANH